MYTLSLSLIYLRKVIFPCLQNVLQLFILPLTQRIFPEFQFQEYLVKETNLSSGALRMIGDILNENSFFYTSLIEALYLQSDIQDEIV